MNTSIAQSKTNLIDEYGLMGLLAAIFVTITTSISIFVIVLVWSNKSRLHTVNHLLVCNTCIASMLYGATVINNFAYLIFGQWGMTMTSCRLQAYFGYSGIAGVIYSYLTQAISRFFFSVLSMKYRWLTTFKTHFILIAINWITVFLLTSPAIITNDVTFTFGSICWVPLRNRIHTGYTAFAYYLLPVIVIILIYICIYVRVRRTTKNNQSIANSENSQKRDLELLRYILILLGLYLAGGLPTIFYMVTSVDLIYYISMVSPSFMLIVEKICTIFLDREIRQIMRRFCCRSTVVRPFNASATGRTGTLTMQQTVRQVNVHKQTVK
ncbi:unnamed protein product [Adineta ricciae]|uniref:G-protein coupled receptors family 1 profile domain-containing protein n=1 Tax=Adineta ricciae TaxID=249248 RepID=A0A815A8D6_ADIRI|nr:unnamed protein product [Adineta ricciae]CAF1251346.1 unnamed protein product [Adineta ricciae]